MKDAKVDLASAAMPQRRQEATRRGFLKSAVAFGGLVATSRLPVFADDVSLFRGRDLFDLHLALPHIDVPTIVRVGREYMGFRNGEVPTAKQFAMNMDEKMALNDYLGDVSPLLRRGVTFDPHEAYSAFKEIVLPLI